MIEERAIHRAFNSGDVEIERRKHRYKLFMAVRYYRIIKAASRDLTALELGVWYTRLSDVNSWNKLQFD